MAKLFFRQIAIDDLTDIWDYTKMKWSEKQADKYYGMIKFACDEIASDSAIGRSYQEINNGLHGYRVGKHIDLAAKRRADQLSKVPNCKLVRLSRWLFDE